MKKSNIKSTFILSVVLILLLSLFIVLRFTNQSVLAADERKPITGASVGTSTTDQTNASKERAIYNVPEWTNTKDTPGSHEYVHTSAPPLRDLIPADQVDGDYIYITVTDLHTIPSLFCTAKGTPLPGYGSAIVSSGGYSTDITDQGKKTAFLTEDDITSATCFRNDERLRTGWETSHTNQLSSTTSRTLGRFGPPTIEQCTPVEAYIMASYNTVSSNNAESFEFTDREYTGTVNERDYGNARTSFNSKINAIAQYAYNNQYTHGNMGDVPIDEDDNEDGMINNSDLIKWALYSMGYKNVDSSNLESSLRSNNFEELKDIKIDELKVGDIIFLKNSSDSDGVVIYCSKTSVYDVSSDEKIKSNQPISRTLKEEEIAKVYRINQNASVNNEATAIDRYDVERLQINGTDIYMVGDPGEEKYVAKKDGKWYYVNINGDSNWTSDSDAQNAWWEKSWHSLDNGSSGFTHTDLADEAQAFSDYVYTVNGITPPAANDPSALREAASKLKKNEDGSFFIDYKTDFEPKDPKQIKVRFNAETNKYLIGPFKADYTRAATKAGDRAKVSFSGISRTLLIGEDADGNELTNEDGTNRLKLGKNYKFVYEDEKVHKDSMNKFDTDEDYPYPCPEEWFYIELDYMDDLVKIKNFKMDFQYMTSGGEYEYFEGKFLTITWEPTTDVVATRAVESSGGGFITNENTQIALNEASNRAGRTENVSNRAGSEYRVTGSYDPKVDFTKVEGGYLIPNGDDNIVDIKRNGEPVTTKTGDTITYKGKVEFLLGNNSTFATFSDFNVKSVNVTFNGNTVSANVSGNTFEAELPKKIDTAFVDEEVKVDVVFSYTVTPITVNGNPVGKPFSSGGSQSESGNIQYYNSFLNEDGSSRLTSDCELKMEGNVIFKEGYILRDLHKFDFDAWDKNPYAKADLEEKYFRYNYFTDNTGLGADNYKLGKFVLHGTGEGGYAPHCRIVADDGTETERITFDQIYVHKMCDEHHNNSSDIPKDKGKGKVQLLNAVIKVDQTSVRDEVLPNAVNFELKAKAEIYYSRSAVTINKDYTGKETLTLTDADGTTYTLNVSFDAVGTTPGGGDDGSGDDGSGDDGSGSGGGEGSTESQYHDYLVSGSASSSTAQQQSNAVGDHTVTDVDAEDGVTETPSGTPVEIEFILEDLDLRTSIGGVVWIDHEPDKDTATSGVMGIADGYNAVTKTWASNKDRANKNQDYPVEANSVEIIVWKVKYEKSGDAVKEIERTKAIGWKTDKKANTTGTAASDPDNEINFIEDKGRLYVDDNGNYSIPYIQVPSVEGKEDNVFYSYDVEFVYDGQSYETTEYLKPTPDNYPNDTFTDEKADAKLAAFKKTADETGKPENHKDYTKYANSSYIVENHDERMNFDKYFTEVFGEKDSTDYKATEGEKSALKDGKTHGYATGGRNGSYYSGLVEDVFVENPENNTASLDYDGSQVEQAKVAKAKVDESGNPVLDENGNPVMEEVDSTEADRKLTISKAITRDDKGFILDQYRFASRTSEAGLLLPYETLYHVDSETPHDGQTNPAAYNNLQFATDIFKPIDEYFDQINMGLLDREITDISLTKDLYTADIVVGNKELKTTFNSYRELENDMLNLNFELLPPSRTYKIDLYNSDYYYRSSIYRTMTDEISKEIVSAVKQGTELRMFLTYKIQIYNSSNNTDVSINEFKDYYDSSFTLITDDVSLEVEESVIEPYTDANGKKVNKATSNNNEKVTKVVAEKPHFRKLKANITSEDAKTLYNHNWTLDSQSTAIDEGLTGDLVFCKSDRTTAIDTKASSTNNAAEPSNNEEISGNESYKISRTATLRALNETKDGYDAKMILQPGESYEVFVTYEVDQSKYNQIAAELANNSSSNAATDVNRDSSLLGSKNNIAELTRYTTIYAEKNGSTHANKLRHSTVSYNIGEISGRIDQDSAPDNVDIKDITISEKAVNDALTNGASGNQENTGVANQATPRYFEDDTHAAPVVKVSVRQDTKSRSIEGVAWDDGKAVQESLDSKENLADGQFTEGGTDVGIPNVDVTLVEKIHITADDYNKAKEKEGSTETAAGLGLDTLDYEFEFVWPNDAFVAGEDVHSTSRVTTDKDGKYRFDNFAPGNYVVRFEYGNKTEKNYRYNESELEGVSDDFDPLKYNGQDYQNTYYQTPYTVNKTGEGDNYKATSSTTGTLKNPTEKSATEVPGTNDEAGIATLNNEWHNLKEEAASTARYSDARDYEPRRIQVVGYSRTISNENAEVLASYINDKAKDKISDDYKAILKEKRAELADNTAMVANTAKLCIEIENQANLQFGKDDNGVTTAKGDEASKETKYEIKNIDFGLALRPETKLNIQQEVNQITLSKNNGKDVVLSVYMDDEGNIISDKSGLTEETKANMTDEEINEIEKSLEQKITSQRKITEIKKENLATGTQGFKYVAVEASFLQGMEVDIRYKLTVFNNSDVDYVGTHISHIKRADSMYNLATKFEAGGDYSELDFQNSPFSTGKGIVYGKYMGLHYYTGVVAEGNNVGTESEDLTRISDAQGKTYLPERYYQKENEALQKDIYTADVVVTTTVDQLVDFIDNDISKFDENTTGGRIINTAWDDSSYTDLYYKISDVSYNENKKDNGGKLNIAGLTDNKNVAYVVGEASAIKDGDVISGELTKVSKNNVAFSHNATMTSTPIVVNYTRTEKVTGEEINSKETTNTDATKTVAAEGDVVVDSKDSSKNKSTVVDISKNLTPALVNKKTVMYTLADESGTSSAFDQSNILLTVELLPNKVFEDAVNKDDKGNATYKVKDKIQTTVVDGAERFNTHVYLLTTTLASSEKINNMNYENLSEIIMYSNTAGRKDMTSIPGNANLIGKGSVANMAGYNRYVMNTVGANGIPKSTQDFFKEVADRGTTEEALEGKIAGFTQSFAKVGATGSESTQTLRLERDAYAARDTVTFSEPTGLSLERQRMNQIVRVILIALTIAAIAVIGITVGMVVKKTKYDDKNLIDSNNKN